MKTDNRFKNALEELYVRLKYVPSRDELTDLYSRVIELIVENGATFEEAIQLRTKSREEVLKVVNARLKKEKEAADAKWNRMLKDCSDALSAIQQGDDSYVAK